MEKRINGDLASSVIADSSMGILILTKELKCIYVNPAVEKITGYAPETLINTKALTTLYNVDEKYRDIENIFLNMKDKDVIEKDVKIIKKSGDPVSINMSGFGTKTRAGDFLIMIIQDISNKKVVEKMLESSIDGFIQTTINLDQAIKTINEQKNALDLYKKNIERELDIARSVQRNITPENFFSNDFVSMWGASMPSTELSGDYFDYFMFDTSKLGVVIADVSGHGVPSALITTMIKVCFDRYAREYVEVENVFKLVNKEIVNILRDTGFYLTAFYSVIDLDIMTISCASAGHDSALCYYPENDEVIEIGITGKGSIIGCFDNAEYESRKYNLKKGCKLIFFTDGFTEARNKNGEFFGKNRLKEYLKENNKLPAKDFGESLICLLDKYYEGAEPNDDRTLFIIDIINVPDLNAMQGDKIESIIDTAFKNGRKYIKNKEFNAAINEFQKVVDLDSGNFGAYSYLGQIFGILRDFNKAEKFLSKSIELNSSYIEGYYYMGSLLYNQKRFTDAKVYWMKLKNMADNFRNINYYLKKIDQMNI